MNGLRSRHEIAIKALSSRKVCFNTGRSLVLDTHSFLLPTWQLSSKDAAASFSTTTVLMKRKRGPKQDRRIKAINYHLKHYKVPRPLRFSRLRALRHWTIHRAWQLYQHKRRKDQELELERLYNSMSDACETLRLMDDDGNMGKEEGRLYRSAMQKQRVWDGIPIEYAKCQTDYPSKEGWDHDWKRR